MQSNRQSYSGVPWSQSLKIFCEYLKGSLTRPELGFPATFCWLGGGEYPPLLPNFKTNWRSEERRAAIESSQREDSNAILKFS